MTDETEQKPTIHSIVRETLNDYHLSNMVSRGTTDPFPLVDLLSNDGATIETGQEEINLISDDIVFALVAQAPESATKQIIQGMGAGESHDAALNLEGAIDTLLIANKMSEEDTVIRTLRRVLGQIEETVRIAELDQVRTIGG